MGQISMEITRSPGSVLGGNQQSGRFCSRKGSCGVALLKSQTRQSNWRRTNLAKYIAHPAVQRALVFEALVKQSCEVCGTLKVDAHHDRYSEPLNVRWLCRRHHVKLHHYGEDMFPIGRCPEEGSRHG